MSDDSSAAVVTGKTPAATRAATLVWQDADLAELDARSRGISGLEFIRGMIDDQVPRPPVAQALGIVVVSADLGRVHFRMEPQPFMTNHLGVVAGGMLSTALDAALGCAVLTLLPAETDVVSLDLSVDFLRPVLAAGGPVSFFAEVVHSGRRRALAQGRVLDAQERLCVHGRSSCLLVAKLA